MKALKWFRNTGPALPELLNYAAMIENGIMLLKSGALMASWMYEAPDTDTLTYDELNARSARINNALQRLGSGWMTQHDVIRSESRKYPNEAVNSFPDAVTRLIDDERRELYTSGYHHENKMVVTLTYLPPTANQTKLAGMMVDGDNSTKNLIGVGYKNLQYFKQACSEFEGTMTAVCNLRRLQGYLYTTHIDGKQVTRDDLLRYVKRCITGEDHPVNLPEVAMFLDCVVGTHEFHTGLLPVLGDKYIGAITIDGFPQTSFPGILEGLDQHNFEYRWSNRFIYEDSVAASTVLNRIRRKWQQKKRGFVAQLIQNYNAPVDKFAETMENQTEDSLAETTSGTVLYGYYTSTIVIMDKDQGAVERGLEAIRNHINNLGFNARTETINAVEAFLGSLPGHSSENLRRPLMHTLNLADLLPMRSIWPGREYCPNPFYPPNSPPLLITSTSGNTPFRLNLHVDDVGHTLILGPTGSGKSTLLAVLAAQFFRYKDAAVYVFEKGHSMYPLVSAIEGGKHFDIGNDDHLGFCPLADLNNGKAVDWAEDWILQCLKLQNVNITPEKRAALKSALNQHAKSQDRSLHDLMINLQDKEMSLALEAYTVNDAKNSAILDAEEDNLETSRFNVFELGGLMEMGDENILPVLTYLFRKIELSLTGKPTMIILDEAWIVLAHPVFRAKIREWLKVLRKANCLVIMATQSISDATGSGILDVINESCQTKIYLPNSTARDESSAKLYKSLGLNTREIDMLAKATPKRDYYFRNPEGRRFFNLQLGPIALAIAGATGKDMIQKVKELKEQHGNKWVSEWFKIQGVY